MLSIDFPRIPSGYTLRQPSSYVTSKLPLPITTSGIWTLEQSARAAATLTLVLHAGDGDDTTAASVVGLGEGANIGELIQHLDNNNDARLERMSVLFIKRGEDQPTLDRVPLAVVIESGLEQPEKSRLWYDDRLVSAQDASWIQDHFIEAWRQISTAKVTTRVDSITFVNDDEREAINRLTSSPAPPSVYPPECNTLPSFFLNAASLYPNTEALVFDSLSLSYSQVLHLSSLLAHELIKIGVQPGSIIPLCVRKSPEMILALLGISLAGAGYLNLEPSFPASRKEGIVKEVQEEGLLGAGRVAVAIIQAEETGLWQSWDGMDGMGLLDPFLFFKPILESLLTLSVDFSLPKTPLPIPKDFNPAYLIYTSGSTGKPKGIIVEHSNVAAFLRNYRNVFGREVGARILQFPSYSFDVSVMNIWDTFAHGATLCMTSQENLLADLAGSILRLQCNVVDLTPTVSTLLFEHPDAQVKEGETILDAWKRSGFEIRQINTGGEKVERWVREAWMERGVRVVIDYGPSETTVGVISNQQTTPLPSIIPIGRPTGSTPIHILSPSLLSVPLGTIGEICVGGDQVSRGYIKKDLNASVFVEHTTYGRIYRTGDLGRYLGDGLGGIECLGRRDGQVKINGLRIEVGEIEQHLTPKLHSDLSRGIVDKVESDSISPRLVAFIVISSTISMNMTSTSSPQSQDSIAFTSTPEYQRFTTELSSRLSTNLPAYMVPQYWLPVSRIPTQGMGKADRKALIRLALEYDFNGSDHPSASNNSERRQDEMYDIVRKLWAQVLKIDESRIEDNDTFTRLGGDSIAFIRFTSLLRSGGFQVSYPALAKATSVTECAEVLRLSSGTATSSHVPYLPFSLLPVDKISIIKAEVDTHLSISVSAIEDIYPTSPSQDSLLAGSIDSSAYYAQAIYSLDQSVSLDLFEKSLATLIGRHPGLRTCFAVLESWDSTLQIVLSEESKMVKECKIEVVEVFETENLDKVIGDWLEVDRKKHNFGWGKLSLSFAVFVQGDVRKFAWCSHHATSDGWTLELLTTDLRAIYYDLDLPARPNFASFVSLWSGNRSSESTSIFWKSYLANGIPLNWPPNLKNVVVSTTRASTIHWTGSLSTIAKNYGITPAISTRIASFVALALHSKSSDVLVGIVRSGRDIDVDRADELIGPCVSVLPSRLRFSPTTTLLDLAKEEAFADKEARAHQLVTLGEISRICNFDTRSDLFNILLTYQSLAERDETAAGAEKPWPIEQPPEQIRMPTSYALSIEITPLRTENQFEITAFYDPSLLQPCEAQAFLGTIGMVLDGFIRYPFMRFDQLEIGGNIGVEVPSNDLAQSLPGEALVGEGNQKLVSDVVLGEIMDRLAVVWSSVLQLNGRRVAPSDRFGSLGGDSISMMRLSVRIGRAGLSIPVAKLAQLPTIEDQARWIILNRSIEQY